MSSYPRIAALRDVAAFREHVASLGLALEADDRIETAPGSPLAQPIEVDGARVGNRWVIHPMEGWDAEDDGNPSELVRRRWRNFGRSGAKWIWGGEAMAVLPEARANPNQLVISEHTRDGLARLLDELLETHRQEVGSTDDLLVGFQLTHSGRFSKPFRKDRPEPLILYRHPILDRKLQLPDDYPLLSDDDVRRIIDRFITAAGIAESCGAAFVDIKHCHGYLGHEFLERAHAAGTLWRLAGEPHAVPARDRRGDPGEHAQPQDRRTVERLRLGAVPARSREKPRAAPGAGHPRGRVGLSALSLWIRRRPRRPATLQAPRTRVPDRVAAAGWGFAC